MSIKIPVKWAVESGIYSGLLFSDAADFFINTQQQEKGQQFKPMTNQEGKDGIHVIYTRFAWFGSGGLSLIQRRYYWLPRQR